MGCGLGGKLVCGLIPAGAGQISRTRPLPRTTTAHPRGCGADKNPQMTTKSPWGSSPRVRGRFHQEDEVRRADGLIPAGAGQIASVFPMVASCAAHPRGCGADLWVMVRGLPSRGSSPRVRGRSTISVPGTSQLGLIPAGAGQMFSFERFVCPEQGSSPRVRGRSYRSAGASCSRRLIPAGAGQMYPIPRSRGTSPAHPRGCGADGVCDAESIPHGGSSPRVRGRYCLLYTSPSPRDS